MIQQFLLDDCRMLNKLTFHSTHVTIGHFLYSSEFSKKRIKSVIYTEN